MLQNFDKHDRNISQNKNKKSLIFGTFELKTARLDFLLQYGTDERKLVYMVYFQSIHLYNFESFLIGIREFEFLRKYCYAETF